MTPKANDTVSSERLFVPDQISFYAHY